MDKHFYARDYNTGRLVELTKEDYLSIFGGKRTHTFANRVLRGAVTIEEVPEDLREAVEQSIIARRERFGEPNKQEISDTEALNIIIGGETV